MIPTPQGIQPELFDLLKKAQRNNYLWDKQDSRWKQADMLVVSNMIFPPEFHANYRSMLMDDLFQAHGGNAVECFIIPTFDPLSINFFNQTAQTPVNPAGMLTESVYADNFNLTPLEFLYHDLKHAWDRYLLFVKASLQSQLSQQESIYYQDKNAELLSNIAQIEAGTLEVDLAISDQIDDFSQKRLADTLYLTLFELLHEEGHSVELQDMEEGLTQTSMYGWIFIERLRKKIDEWNFFKPKGENDFLAHLPYLDASKEIIQLWVKDLMIKNNHQSKNLQKAYHQEDSIVKETENKYLVPEQFSQHMTFFKEKMVLSLKE